MMSMFASGYVVVGGDDMLFRAGSHSSRLMDES